MDWLKNSMMGLKKEKEKNIWAWCTNGSSGLFWESTWVAKATLAITSMVKQPKHLQNTHTIKNRKTHQAISLSSVYCDYLWISKASPDSAYTSKFFIRAFVAVLMSGTIYRKNHNCKTYGNGKKDTNLSSKHHIKEASLIHKTTKNKEKDHLELQTQQLKLHSCRSHSISKYQHMHLQIGDA